VLTGRFGADTGIRGPNKARESGYAVENKVRTSGRGKLSRATNTRRGSGARHRENLEATMSVLVLQNSGKKYAPALVRVIYSERGREREGGIMAVFPPSLPERIPVLRTPLVRVCRREWERRRKTYEYDKAGAARNGERERRTSTRPQKKTLAKILVRVLRTSATRRCSVESPASA
jgi:hypothetical protein